jgi:predicted transcriptional regulator
MININDLLYKFYPKGGFVPTSKSYTITNATSNILNNIMSQN